MKKIQDLNEQEKKLYALEALFPMPFVLKGSLLTRQYLENPKERDVKDIDFLYAGEVEDEQEAYGYFTVWLIQATKIDLHDGVVFQSFKDQVDWQPFDYGMVDVFPTTNTDIYYRFKDESGAFGHLNELSLDVSFNLKFENLPEPK